MSDRIVYVYGAKSRIHLAVEHSGQLLTPERCNWDDVVGERMVVDSLDDVPDTKEMCERCFPVSLRRQPAGAVQPAGDTETSA